MTAPPMKTPTLGEIEEARGRAYAQALLNAERIRAMTAEEFAAGYGIDQPDGTCLVWRPDKPCWREEGPAGERWVPGGWKFLPDEPG